MPAKVCLHSMLQVFFRRREKNFFALLALKKTVCLKVLNKFTFWPFSISSMTMTLRKKFFLAILNYLIWKLKLKPFHLETNSRMLPFWEESDVFWNRQNTYGVEMILWFQKEAAHFIVSAVTFLCAVMGMQRKSRSILSTFLTIWIIYP